MGCRPAWKTRAAQNRRSALAAFAEAGVPGAVRLIYLYHCSDFFSEIECGSQTGRGRNNEMSKLQVGKPPGCTPL
jgi:hypothetical protein